MKDILALVATGFEDTELISSINVFARGGLSFDLVSVENLDQVRGKLLARVKTLKMQNVNLQNYRAIFIPGGPGYEIALNNEGVIALVKDYYHKKRILAAICAAPAIFDKAKIIDNKLVSAFGASYVPSAQYNQASLTISGNIITGKDYEATIPFAKAVVKILKEKSPN